MQGEFQYFVHYQGWNKNWDEWVPEDRVLKNNTEGYARKEKLLASHAQKVSLKNKKGTLYSCETRHTKKALESVYPVV